MYWDSFTFENMYFNCIQIKYRFSKCLVHPQQRNITKKYNSSRFPKLPRNFHAPSLVSESREILYQLIHMISHDIQHFREAYTNLHPFLEIDNFCITWFTRFWKSIISVSLDSYDNSRFSNFREPYTNLQSFLKIVNFCIT